MNHQSQKSKSNQSNQTLEQAQHSVMTSLVNLASHPDAQPEVTAWLESLCHTILGQTNGEISPVAEAYRLLAESIVLVANVEGRGSHVTGILEDAAFEVFNLSGHQDELEFIKIQLIEAGKWKARNARRSRKGGGQ